MIDISNYLTLRRERELACIRAERGLRGLFRRRRIRDQRAFVFDWLDRRKALDERVRQGDPVALILRYHALRPRTLLDLILFLRGRPYAAIQADIDAVPIVQVRTTDLTTPLMSDSTPTRKVFVFRPLWTGLNVRAGSSCRLHLDLTGNSLAEIAAFVKRAGHHFNPNTDSNLLDQHNDPRLPAIFEQQMKPVRLCDPQQLTDLPVLYLSHNFTVSHALGQHLNADLTRAVEGATGPNFATLAVIAPFPAQPPGTTNTAAPRTLGKGSIIAIELCLTTKSGAVLLSRRYEEFI